MRFDPALAARQSFERVQQTGELGAALEAILEAEDTFSSSAGAEATHAYFRLLAIGEQYPEAAAFQEFLIYITWQQAVEDTVPVHFQTGAELCDRFLRRHGARPGMPVEQVRELRASFRAGLGWDEEEPDDYAEDSVKGGD
jgi:hypothetical protein